MDDSPQRATTRHDARHQAITILFAADVRDVSPLWLLENDPLPFEDTIHPYATQVVKLVFERLDEIDAMISEHLHTWELDRVAAVDRNALRIATAEMLYIPDTPVPVAITEAVKLVTELSSDDSPRFINGVLGSIGDIAQEQRLARKAQQALDAQERAEAHAARLAAKAALAEGPQDGPQDGQVDGQVDGEDTPEGTR